MIFVIIKIVNSTYLIKTIITNGFAEYNLEIRMISIHTFNTLFI